MASSATADSIAIRSNIQLISELLCHCAPGDVIEYQAVLDELHSQLAEAQQVEASIAGPSGTSGQWHQADALSAEASEPNERKRSLAITDTEFPAGKRVAIQHNQPVDPGLVVDLISSGSTSPVPNPESSLDPFPELDDAYRVNHAHPVPFSRPLDVDAAHSGPTDAFQQDFMQPVDPLEFMVNPTQAGRGYAFMEQPVAGDQPKSHAFVDREAPYLPDIERSHWTNDQSHSDDDEEVRVTAMEADAIEELLENIQEQRETTEEREPTPKTMCSELKEFQKMGLTWLLKMENGRSKGGILADEMGLGKTIQALALICARPSTDPLRKTTLIIAPVALMRQWEKEIETHVRPSHALKVFMYWGNGKRTNFNGLRRYDIVLTTFGILASEWKQVDSGKENILRERELRQPYYRRRPEDELALLGRGSMWYRVILDEAHTIKNRRSIQSRATDEIQAIYRLCLTGTPMMNSVDELYPLLRFLRIPPYSEWASFNQDIAKPVRTSRGTARKQGMNRVQILLKSIMLRRQKSSIVDGVQICTIPAKHTTIDNVEFSDDEHIIYKALEAKSQIQFNRYLDDDGSTNYANMLVLLLRLRQACCHPHLIKDFSQAATKSIAEDDLLARAKMLSQDVIERLQAADSESFECPVCLEANPNPTIIIPCGHTVCGECVQILLDPARAAQEGNGEGSIPKCPHCRGDLQAKSITDYKHFCKVYCPDRLNHSLGTEFLQHEESETEESSDDSYSDVDERGNLAGFVVSDDEEYDLDVGEAKENSTKSNEEIGADVAMCRVKRSKGKKKTRMEPMKTLAQLKKESRSSKTAKHRYLRRLEKTFVSSAKVDKIVQILCDVKARDPTEKTLIFSQFTSLLDLVEVPLAQQRIRYQRYDGSMRLEERTDAVDTFMSNPNENVMLISLKAGNAGLNLWKASQVIILDPFWNPYIEDQAVDRAHRMPQPREVTVHRVLVPETVEDRICVLQDKKREVIGAALDEKASKSLTRLSHRELSYLFGLTRKPC